MTSENAPDSTFTFTLEISTDGRVRGSVDSEFVNGKIFKTSFDATTNKIKFTLSSNMGEIVYDATVSGEEMTGTLGIEDAFSTGFIAKRVKEEDIAESSDAAEADNAAKAVQAEVKGNNEKAASKTDADGN